jgi:hypothetical protein
MTKRNEELIGKLQRGEVDIFDVLPASQVKDDPRNSAGRRATLKDVARLLGIEIDEYYVDNVADVFQRHADRGLLTLNLRDRYISDVI